MFEELLEAFKPYGGNYLGRRAFASGLAWIVLQQVKDDIFMAVRAGIKYPAPVEMVKIAPNEFIDGGVF